MQMNHRVEQNYYLVAQGFVSPHHWLQGLEPGHASQALRGGGKDVACSKGIWPWAPSTQNPGKAARGRMTASSLESGSSTAFIQGLGSMPPRHVDRDKPRVRAPPPPPASLQPCLCPPRDQGWNSSEMRHSQKPRRKVTIAASALWPHGACRLG